MIEKFFTQPATLSRLQSGMFGPHLPAVASSLDQSGYSAGSIRLHLRAADHFGTWLLEQKIEIHDVNVTVVAHHIACSSVVVQGSGIGQTQWCSGISECAR